MQSTVEAQPASERSKGLYLPREFKEYAWPHLSSALCDKVMMLLQRFDILHRRKGTVEEKSRREKEEAFFTEQPSPLSYSRIVKKKISQTREQEPSLFSSYFADGSCKVLGGDCIVIPCLLPTSPPPLEISEKLWPPSPYAVDTYYRTYEFKSIYHEYIPSLLHVRLFGLPNVTCTLASKYGGIMTIKVGTSSREYKRMVERFFPGETNSTLRSFYLDEEDGTEIMDDEDNVGLENKAHQWSANANANVDENVNRSEKRSRSEKRGVIDYLHNEAAFIQYIPEESR